jgi:hypothetical protein
MYTLIIFIFVVEYGSTTSANAKDVGVSSIPGFQTLALCESAARKVMLASIQVAGANQSTVCVQTK